MKEKGRIIGHATFQMKQRLKRQGVEDSRKVPRFDFYFAMPTLKSINRVGGAEVNLIEISRRGALINSREHMSPGSNISLRLVTAETIYVIKGRVIRCGISPTSDRLFQSAIAFDKDFTILPESINLLEDEDFLK